MLREEIIQKISQYFKLTEKEAEKVFLELFSGIIQGVKKDNIVDIDNFGEFVIRYTNGKNSVNGGQQHYKKSIEFLPSPELEDEINQVSKKETLYNIPEKNEGVNIEEQKSDDESVEKETKPPISDSSSVEDEIRRKREEILKKISNLPNVSEQETKEFIYEEKQTAEEESTLLKEEDAEKLKDTSKETEKEIKSSDETATNKEFEDSENVYHLHTEPEIKEQVPETEKSSKEEPFEQPVKSFNDFFEEVNKEIPPPLKKTETETPQVTKTPVIPKTAVELHNEITGASEDKINIPPPLPVLEVKEEPVQTPKSGEESYYIWYKDAESSESETQTMSYEYELLYQAAKEAEYKSKLKVYVSSFIVFFSLVLILLIFSPLIYKYFFTSSDIEFNQLKSEETTLPETNKQEEQPQQQQSTQQQPPTQEQTTQQQLPTQEQPTQQPQQQTTTEQNIQQKQDQPQPPTQQTQTQPTQQPPTTEPIIEGLVKNSMGWTDEKYKVIYIKLENGKYTIQESAWDSDAKAQKRVNNINGMKISGLTGTYIKADLGDKGIWFRTRFGEFSTIEEAREKAQELRSKEGLKLHALLLSIFLYA